MPSEANCRQCTNPRACLYGRACRSTYGKLGPLTRQEALREAAQLADLPGSLTVHDIRRYAASFYR